MKRKYLQALCIVTSVVLLGCNSNTKSSVSSTQKNISSENTTIEVFADYPYYDSAEDLVDAANLILCGKVTKISKESIDISSKQINIYGHNSRYYDVVFKRLEKYLDKDFYKSNRYISLITVDDVFNYEIFSVNVTDSENHLDFSSSFNDRVKFLKTNSLYDTGVDVSDDDYLLVLQTCIYNRSGGLLVISAKKVNF